MECQKNGLTTLDNRTHPQVAYVGTQLSVSGTTKFASLSLVADSKVGGSLTLRSFAKLGSSVSVLDFIAMGSSLSVRSFSSPELPQLTPVGQL